jgi:hypothetical protein
MGEAGLGERVSIKMMCSRKRQADRIIVYGGSVSVTGCGPPQLYPGVKGTSAKPDPVEETGSQLLSKIRKSAPEGQRWDVT